MPADKAKIFSGDASFINDAGKLGFILGYASANASENTDRLRFASYGKPDAELINFACDQIEIRRKYRAKLPTFTDRDGFVFPSRLAVEQATNEAVARYHASLYKDEVKTFADITAGLGIDAMTRGESARGIAAELDPLKEAALRHNATALKLKTVCGDGLEMVGKLEQPVDLIFADPARRGENDCRVYDPTDCLPDVVGNNATLLDKCRRLMVKHSPMLDLSAALRLFPHLEAIHIVCHKGECKELLTIQNASYEDQPTIVCANIKSDDDIEVLSYNQATPAAEVQYLAETGAVEGMYLYHPNPAVMKSGAWGQLTARFPALMKADISTHIFFSSEYYPDFPGRILKVESILDKRGRAKLKNCKFNVVARNYVCDVKNLVKSLKIKEGGTDFIYALRISDTPLLLTAKPL